MRVRRRAVVRGAVLVIGIAVIIAVGLRLADVMGWTGGGGQVASTPGPGGPGGAFFGGQGGAAAPIPVSVRAEPVRVGTVEEIAMLSGTLGPRYEVDVFPRRGGRLLSVAVEVGDQVVPGDVLAVVEHTDLLLQERQAAAGLAVARASLQRATSQLERAQAEYDRAVLLRSGGAATEQELRNAANQLQEAEIQREVTAAQLEQSETSHQLIQLQLNQVHIDTPVAGVVIARPVVAGSQVGTSTSVAVVAGLDPIEVVFYVPERDIGRLQLGQRFVLDVDAYPRERFTGEVASLGASIDQRTRSVAVRGSVPNPDLRLRPGMFARVELVIERSDTALWLPREALMTGSAGYYVFVAQNDRAMTRMIEVGIQGRDRFQVLSGLTEGELVISVGQQAVRNGQLIQLAPGGGGS